MSAKQFYHDIDLVNVGQLIGARIQNVTTAERNSLGTTFTNGTPTDHIGLQVWDTTIDAPYVWDGSQWVRDALVVNGDIVFQGTVDATSSLDAQATAATGNQYAVSVAGTLSMTGVTFSPTAVVEVGDMVLFTSATEATVLQRNLDGALVDADFATAGIMATNGSGTYSIITDNSTNWDAAYNDKINSASFATATGIITLTQQDGGTVTVDIDGRYHEQGVDIPDADISQSSVTQHQAALTITESQISDLQSYLTSVALNDVTDVTITAAATGDFLRYNGTAWVDSTIQDSDIAQSAVTQHEAALSITESQISDLQAYLLNINSENIGDLANVTITAAATGDFLRYNGTAWVDSTIQDSDIAQSAVTQHEAALSITESQISDLQAYLLNINSENIGDLANVTITAAATGDFLRYNGTAWVDSTIQDSDIAQSAVTQHEAALSIAESQISLTNALAAGFTATDLSGAVNELEGEINTLQTDVTSLQGRAEVGVYTATGITLTANTPFTVSHNLALSDQDFFTIRVCDSNGSSISVDVDSVNANSLTLTSLVTISNVKIVIFGVPA